MYLDDILIYSEDVNDHEKHVKEVLEALRTHRLFAKLEDCEFSIDTVEFLGYIISPKYTSQSVSSQRRIFMGL